MFHQLSESERADIRRSIEESEAGMAWLIRLRSLYDNRVKSNETQNKTKESEGKVISRQLQTVGCGSTSI